MILMTARIIKLLMLAAILIIGFLVLRKKLSDSKLAGLGVLAIVFAITANTISGFLPPLTDSVTLTALGESRKEAKGQEIFLEGYTIDKRSFSSGESLEIQEGHWFWSGETYAWRPGTDSRQPPGVTRTVVLRIPVGCSRSLDFTGNEYKGIVQIQVGDSRWNIDTYSASDSVISAGINKSDTSVLIWNQIRYLVVYTVTLLLLWAVAMGVIRISLRDPTYAWAWLDKNLGKLIRVGIGSIVFVLMLSYADKYSLWVDELIQVGITSGTLKETLYSCLTMRDIAPPLSDLVCTIWRHIIPYGEKWLLLPMILLSVLAIYLMGSIGEKISGRTAGVLSSIFAACSSTVWLSVAFEYRGYPFLVFFSTLSLYCYVQYNNNMQKTRWCIAFSFSMLSMAMSHYFGMLACFGFFCSDVCLFLRKQVTIKRIIPYLLPGTISTLWLGAVLVVNGAFKDTAGWLNIPTPASIKNCLEFLTGNVDFTYGILLLGISIGLVCVFAHKESEEGFYFAFFSGVIVCSMAAIYFYGNFLNTNVTLWSNRYFLFLIPHISILSSMTVLYIIRLLSPFSKQSKIYPYVCLFWGFYLSLNCLSVVSTKSLTNTYQNSSYREAADWIYTQSDIFDDDTLIYCINIGVADGWNKYYITREGRRDELNIKKRGDIGEYELLMYNRIYLLQRDLSTFAWLQNILNRNYTLVLDMPNIDVSVYVRK